MDNSLLAVRDINHKYIVVERRGFYNNLSSDSFGEEKAYERITTNQ